MSLDDLSSEEIEKAFKALLKITRRAVEVVRRLDGKTDYITIGNELGLHKTIVSSVQKESYKSKLTKKIGRFYKRKPGILRHAPKIKIDLQSNNNHKKLNRMKKRIVKKIEPKKNSANINLRISEAQKMAYAYQWLYITENALRDLIRKVYGKTDIWWNVIKVPQGIIDSVALSKTKEKYDSTKRADELEYTNLDQLKEIITKKSNWNNFTHYLEVKELNKFRIKFEGALSPRNCIAHSAPLKDKDLKIVDVRFEDILNMIK